MTLWKTTELQERPLCPSAFLFVVMQCDCALGNAERPGAPEKPATGDALSPGPSSLHRPPPQEGRLGTPWPLPAVPRSTVSAQLQPQSFPRGLSKVSAYMFSRKRDVVKYGFSKCSPGTSSVGNVTWERA